MRTTRQLSITLPNEMAQMVHERVARGDYASESEVIREGLRSLMARDAAQETWLREQVAPALAAYDADPSDAVELDDAFDRVQAEYRARHAHRR